MVIDGKVFLDFMIGVSFGLFDFVEILFLDKIEGYVDVV